MNSIAQRALDRAREIPAAVVVAPAQAAIALPEIVITGPINRVIQLEGSALRRGCSEVARLFNQQPAGDCQHHPESDSNGCSLAIELCQWHQAGN